MCFFMPGASLKASNSCCFFLETYIVLSKHIYEESYEAGCIHI